MFGRPRVISHGHSTTDTRTYGQAGNNYRLQSIETEWTGVSPPILNYSYAAYTPTGQLAQLSDLRNPTGVLSNTAAYAYDGLGRLKVASGPNLPAPNTYGYDYLGNIGYKEGILFSYNPTKPDQLATINGNSSGIAYDDNGNRTGKPGQIYTYDAEDRLTAANTNAVLMRYDYAGRQVLKATAAGSVTRYFSEYAEAGSDGTFTKYYFAVGLRIASQQISWQPQQVASVPAAVQVAQVAAGRPVLLLMVRADVQRAAALGLAALFIGLLLVPGRKRRVVGIAVRRGHVLVVLLAWTVGTLPLPLIVRPFGASPAWAGGGGGGGGGGGNGSVIKHYHVDHLGSTQAITTSNPFTAEYVRYKPYGAPSRWTSAGAVDNTTYRYEFTGYETDVTTGLEYAGARYYDPALGMFLTHDPTPSYSSPYCYVGWNPVNQTDPHGDCPICIALIIIVAASIAAAGIDAYIRTGDIGTGVRASLAASAATAVGPNVYGLELLDPHDFGKPDARAIAIANIPIGGQVYGTIQNFRQGNYASGVVGAVATVFELWGAAQAAYDAYQGYSGTAQGSNLGANKTSLTNAEDLVTNQSPAVEQISASLESRLYEENSPDAVESLNWFKSNSGRYEYDANLNSTAQANVPQGLFRIPGVRWVATHLGFRSTITFGQASFFPDKDYFAPTGVENLYDSFLHELSHFYPGTTDSPLLGSLLFVETGRSFAFRNRIEVFATQ